MRTAFTFATVILCCVIVCLTGCSPSQSQTRQADPPVLERRGDFHWPQGKRAAISLTFDDARLSQVDHGIGILDEYGFKATFYVSIDNLKKRLDGWKKAVAAGHEIGNHSLTHPCSGNFPFSRSKALENYTLDMMRDELDQANNIIEQLLGVRPVSFAYPCGQKYVGRGKNLKSYVPLVAERFLSGRGWLDEWANDPAFCDMPHLMGVKLDDQDFKQIKNLMDRTLAEGGWLVFCGHEIGKDGRQTTRSPTLRALCRYAQDPNNGLWLDTVENIAGYILKQRTKKGG